MAGAMRQLFLLRHAKSCWDNPALPDFSRPLAQRGSKAARLVGKEMASRGWIPDMAIVSAAVRTRQTWERIVAQWPKNICVFEFSDAIYEAQPERILAEIRKANGSVQSLLVIGHNPGLETLAWQLASAASDATALRAMSRKFPTGAVVRLQTAERWANLHAACADLTHFLRPKDLA
jgi:phosphohistidine phosphatase